MIASRSGIITLNGKETRGRAGGGRNADGSDRHEADLFVVHVMRAANILGRAPVYIEEGTTERVPVLRHPITDKGSHR